MQITINRIYHPTGTNGTLTINGAFICYTIELPWLNNQPQLSCIPEGQYKIVPRFSKKHGKHLLIKDVPGRALILLHPANNAQKELKGCIAPVSVNTGPGKGSASRRAFNKLMATVIPAIGNEPILITILKNKNHDVKK